MAYSRVSGVRVAAVSAVVPIESVSLADEVRYYGGNMKKVEDTITLSGFNRRRTAPEGVTASDLCIEAANRLFVETGTPRDSIDALFFASQSPDYLLPASSAVQQYELGLASRCAVMDMNLGCAAYVNTLWIASGMLASGMCRRVLILAGEAFSRHLNPENRIVAPVFGDGGTATLLERDESAPPMSFSLGTQGKDHEVLAVPGGGARIPPVSGECSDAPFYRIVRDRQGNPWTLGGYSQLWMDGVKVFNFAVSVIPPHLADHLKEEGVEAEALDRLILHQGNRLMVENIAKKLGVPKGKAPWSTLSKFGNQGGRLFRSPCATSSARLRRRGRSCFAVSVWGSPGRHVCFPLNRPFFFRSMSTRLRPTGPAETSV